MVMAGEQIDLLVDKSENLGVNARLFNRKSSKLRNQMWCKSYITVLSTKGTTLPALLGFALCAWVTRGLLLACSPVSFVIVFLFLL